jgi:hypothetical protein
MDGRNKRARRIIMEEKRWCYYCGETKPLTPEYWAWANKEHTKYRTKCRKCTNYDSMISHRIHREDKKKEKRDHEKNRND